MRLLLDEMHAPAAARSLRDRGLDVLAVQDVPGLRGATDEEVLAAATGLGRAVVTENVRDFASLARAWAAAGRDHAGIVFTDPLRFARSQRSYPGNLVRALAKLEPPPGLSWVWWL